MKIKIHYLLVLICSVIIFNCQSDDDSSSAPPPRDRTEQQIVDRDSLIGYLETHYYNSSLFETPGNYTNNDIIIVDSPLDGYTRLIDAVETHTTVFADTDYEFYVLKINQGGGEQPTIADNIKIKYRGNTQDEMVFDSTANADNPLDMTGLIQGWREIIPMFSTAASGPEISPEGNLIYNNYGFGVMFLPSGLGYFNRGVIGVLPYSNLIFRFELFETENIDHDGDGVPSHLEDLNENRVLTDDNTDGDQFPNFFDSDDDGDGVFTLFEDIDNDGDPTNDDTDNDGIPNYLDADSTESNQDDAS